MSMLLARAGEDDFRVQIKDKLRKGDSSGTPLQYIHEDADCRIFYTAQTLQHPEALWEAAWMANKNRTLCVPGSTLQESSISGTYEPAGPGGFMSGNSSSGDDDESKGAHGGKLAGSLCIVTMLSFLVPFVL